jgi:ABC-2 type transport system permease protein
MYSLISNEMTKLIGRRKFIMVGLIIAVLLCLFAYAQTKQAESIRERIGTSDWRQELQQQIIDGQNRLSNAGPWREQLQIRLQQMQYYLDHDINPSQPGAPTFIRGFLENSTELFLPLLIMMVAADMVSSERSLGTIKLLLTRPVSRFCVLLSKYLTLVLSVSMIMLIYGLLTFAISAITFGNEGWTAPVLTGFSSQGGELDISAVRLIPQWQYILHEFGLAWYVSLVIGTLSFMLSVLIRSTAAGMGVMIACLISGAILSNMVSSWESAKYLFMVNLGVIGYLEGSSPPVEGMTLSFSLLVLLVWAIAGLITAFAVFMKKDVY